MFNMIDIENSVIFVSILLVFAAIYVAMLILVLVGSPASVACFAVDGQRLQKSSFGVLKWSVRLTSKTPESWFLLLASFWISPVFARFHQECVRSCSLVAIKVSAVFQSARKYYVNEYFEVRKWSTWFTSESVIFVQFMDFWSA